jgi:cytochrome c peroxidase
MKTTLTLGILVSVIIIGVGCQKEENLINENYSTVPVLPATPHVYSFSTNNHLATLGRVLFFDKKLSVNNSVACGSCHLQSKAFADGKQFSTGLQDIQTRRNTPAVMVHDNQLFWDGRAQNFHELAVMPLENHVEMKNYDLNMLRDKVASISYYPELFTAAFGDGEVSIDRIQTAIADFLNNFRFHNNKFNNVMAGNAQYTPLEQAGSTIFFGKARCGSCHGGNTLSGWSGGSECIGLDEDYADNGLGELTGNTFNNGSFRIPTLFNIALTAPYMHDGRFATLEEVVEHYNSGIQPHPNLSWALRDFEAFNDMTLTEIFNEFDTNHDGEISEDEIPAEPPVRLNLSESEKKALIAFLHTLSDFSVYTDIRFGDPFVIR